MPRTPLIFALDVFGGQSATTGVTMEVGEAQRLQPLGLGDLPSNAYFRSHPCNHSSSI